MTPKPPSARQLTYLKALAVRTGQTFTYPTTSSDASREIRRLKTVAPHQPRGARARAPRRRRGAGGARGQLRRPDPPSEIEGYGSTATWSRRS